MEEMNVNAEHDKFVDSKMSQTGPRSSDGRFYRAVALCLGLLSVFLLVGLALGLHYHNLDRGSATDFSVMKDNLTQLLLASDNKLSSLAAERGQLDDRLSSLTAKKDQLDAQISNVTKEKDQLKSRLIEMTKDRDRLENLTRKTCPAGWTKFNCSFYFLSTESGSWTKAREDCQNKGADLVIINSAEEQEFLSGFTNQSAWIGLTDIAEEGTWKWVDGSLQTFTYWDVKQPNDRNGEDCAEIDPQTGHKWNDLPCGHSMKWICEKNV